MPTFVTDRSLKSRSPKRMLDSNSHAAAYLNIPFPIISFPIPPSYIPHPSLPPTTTLLHPRPVPLRTLIQTTASRHTLPAPFATLTSASTFLAASPTSLSRYPLPPAARCSTACLPATPGSYNTKQPSHLTLFNN
ncbi:hypothetical protein DM02DRAFT_100034 [Periconia macrospinosa]|uniref:Uncharacterized protein n=1 Tax=Periconia macrospinosa TaxID=97972 RepID=A0A2V1E730_9PLEO|nr:hypothetical protein DM02DRAFT_100034 [Periconia macrospinosa]